MEFNKPIWWARDGASILKSAGNIEHADAVEMICDRIFALEDIDRLEWCFEHGAMAVRHWGGIWHVVDQYRVLMTYQFATPRETIDDARRRYRE